MTDAVLPRPARRSTEAFEDCVREGRLVLKVATVRAQSFTNGRGTGEDVGAAGESLKRHKPKAFLDARVDHKGRLVVDKGDAVLARPLEPNAPFEPGIPRDPGFQGFHPWRALPDEVEIVRDSVHDPLERSRGRPRVLDCAVHADLDQERSFGGGRIDRAKSGLHSEWDRIDRDLRLQDGADHLRRVMAIDENPS